MDKLITGIILFFVSESIYFNTEMFIRWVTVLLPSFFLGVAWVFVHFGKLGEYGNK